MGDNTVGSWSGGQVGNAAPPLSLPYDRKSTDFSAEQLSNGWWLFHNCRLGPATIPIVLVKPATGVALVEISPAWTPRAITLLREKLAASGFEQRFTGYLPVVHRRLRPEDLVLFEEIISEAFTWQDAISLEGDGSWEEAVRRALYAPPSSKVIQAARSRQLLTRGALAGLAAASAAGAGVLLMPPLGDVQPRAAASRIEQPSPPPAASALQKAMLQPGLASPPTAFATGSDSTLLASGSGSPSAPLRDAEPPSGPAMAGNAAPGVSDLPSLPAGGSGAADPATPPGPDGMAAHATAPDVGPAPPAAAVRAPLADAAHAPWQVASRVPDAEPGEPEGIATRPPAVGRTDQAAALAPSLLPGAAEREPDLAGGRPEERDADGRVLLDPTNEPAPVAGARAGGGPDPLHAAAGVASDRPADPAVPSGFEDGSVPAAVPSDTPPQSAAMPEPEGVPAPALPAATASIQAEDPQTSRPVPAALVEAASPLPASTAPASEAEAQAAAAEADPGPLAELPVPQVRAEPEITPPALLAPSAAPETDPAPPAATASLVPDEPPAAPDAASPPVALAATDPAALLPERDPDAQPASQAHAAPAQRAEASPPDPVPVEAAPTAPSAADLAQDAPVSVAEPVITPPLHPTEAPEAEPPSADAAHPSAVASVMPDAPPAAPDPAPPPNRRAATDPAGLVAAPDTDAQPPSLPHAAPAQRTEASPPDSVPVEAAPTAPPAADLPQDPPTTVAEPVVAPPLRLTEAPEANPPTQLAEPPSADAAPATSVPSGQAGASAPQTADPAPLAAIASAVPDEPPAASDTASPPIGLVATDRATLVPDPEPGAQPASQAHAAPAQREEAVAADPLPVEAEPTAPPAADLVRDAPTTVAEPVVTPPLRLAEAPEAREPPTTPAQNPPAQLAEPPSADAAPAAAASVSGGQPARQPPATPAPQTAAPVPPAGSGVAEAEPRAVPRMTSEPLATPPAAPPPDRAPQAAGVAQAPARPPPTLPPALLDAMLRRGVALMGDGDVSGARRFFLRAAEGGSADAALALAETHDPLFLRRRGVVGMPPDREAALTWYRRARELGAAQAADRITSLEATR